MSELLATLYPWTLSFHVISVIAWMAGLFYLPRLYVYHTERVQPGGETDLLFQRWSVGCFGLSLTPQ